MDEVRSKYYVLKAPLLHGGYIELTTPVFNLSYVKEGVFEFNGRTGTVSELGLRVFKRTVIHRDEEVDTN